MECARVDGGHSVSPRVFLVAAPRAGAGLLHDLLRADERWTASELSERDVIAEFPGMSLGDRGYISHRLTSDDLSPELLSTLAPHTSDDEGHGVAVDWNPLHAMRVSLLAEAFPESSFVLVTRPPRSGIDSGIDAWKSGAHASVADLPGWWGEPWSFPLIEGWRDLVGSSLDAIVAAQWTGIVAPLLADLKQLPPRRWTATSLAWLLGDPRSEIERITAHFGLDWNAALPEVLPRTGGAIRPELRPERPRRGTPPPAPVFDGVRAHVVAARTAPSALVRADRQTMLPANASVPFAVTYTAALPGLLAQADCSLLLTTYKGGHVITVGSDGEALGFHVVNVERPMGAAVSGSRLAICTSDAVMTYTAHRGLVSTIDAPDSVDTVYAPRSTVITGDVSIHELAYGSAGLWFVNTRFSCLCLLDREFSFVPSWRPPWVTALSADDRCHLNGMAMRDGRPSHVTAVAQTDTAYGWRDLTGTSGVIVDVASNDVILEGLAMPHSPRWHDGRMWVLESGRGALCTVDVATGATTTIAALPGFTRGLTFVGHYALVGLSQVRDTIFSDLPVTAQRAERSCGVWAIDTRTGQVAGFIRFDTAVQELFDVQTLPGSRGAVILDRTEATRSAFVLPDAALGDVG